MTGIVAIHQPNFFPWLGFFDKARRADVFVFLDEAAYPRAGSGGMGSWTNRVRILVQGEPRWIGCPLVRAPLGTPINAIRIDDAQPWRTKMIKTLQACYARAPRYASTMAWLEPLVRTPETRLAEYNIAVIREIADRLGLAVRFVRQSDLPVRGLSSTELLVALVRAVDANAYLEGGGASGYQIDGLFADAGIELVKQNFEPSPYGPADRYRPGLSVIDYLMYDGRPLGGAGGRTGDAEG